MKNVFHYTLFCFCILLFTYSCKHKKTAVSKGKVQKQVAVKQSPKPAIKQVATEPQKQSAGFTVLHKQLGIPEKEIKSSKLFSFITDWYGAPYKYGGCQRSGVDCSCFTSILCETVYNRKVPRSAGDMYKECEKLTLEETHEGDLLFFKISGSSISHVGVFLKDKWFVHSSTSKGVIISSVEEAYYKKYFHAGGRIKNI